MHHDASLSLQDVDATDRSNLNTPASASPAAFMASPHGTDPTLLRACSSHDGISVLGGSTSTSTATLTLSPLLAARGALADVDKRRYQILVVDDVIVNQKVVKNMLNRLGYPSVRCLSANLSCRYSFYNRRRFAWHPTGAKPLRS
jgi:hypothetical protein